MSEQESFNVDSWLAQGKQALGALHQRKRDIAAQRVELEKEEAEVDKQIVSIEAVFGAQQPERRSGVIDLCRDVVKDIEAFVGKEGVPEDECVRSVLERDPLMKDSSIRNAFRNLAKKNELERFGKRGHYRYRKVAAGNGEGGEVPSEATDTASPEERIETKLISAGKDGVPVKDLSWIVGDNDHTMLILDQLMTDGKIETFPVGEGVFHYRLKEFADPAGEEEPQSSMFG